MNSVNPQNLEQSLFDHTLQLMKERIPELLSFNCFFCIHNLQFINVLVKTLNESKFSYNFCKFWYLYLVVIVSCKISIQQSNYFVKS